MVLGNREKYVTTSETQTVLKKGCVVCTLTSDYHEFFAVILVTFVHEEAWLVGFLRLNSDNVRSLFTLQKVKNQKSTMYFNGFCS